MMKRNVLCYTLGTLALIGGWTNHSSAIEAVVPTEAIPIKVISEENYRYYHSVEYSQYMLVQTASAQKHLGISPRELDLIRNLVSQAFETRDGVIRARTVVPAKQRVDLKKLQKGFEDILGKERSLRLRQIALQTCAPTRTNLVTRLQSDRSGQFAPDIFTDKDRERARVSNQEYIKSFHELVKQRRTMTQEEFLKENAKINKKLEQGVTDETWKRFQAACGEKYSALHTRPTGGDVAPGARVIGGPARKPTAKPAKASTTEKETKEERPE